ncbi:hypothetical protein P9139_08305 [Curtobacterium flaccumfaciens]|nr:hypothetical protein P9139_08305 [Curtobacterium flaccumfaciens]
MEEGRGRDPGEGREKLTIKLPYGAGAIINQDGTTALQAVQQQVKEVGFDLELIPLTQTQLFSGQGQAVDEEDLKFGYWVWPAPNILDIVYNAGTADAPNGNNSNHFDDPAIQAKIDAAQVEPDEAKRKADYEALQQWFDDEAISVGFYDFTNNVVTSKDLKGFTQDQGSNGLPLFADAYLVE